MVRAIAQQVEDHLRVVDAGVGEGAARVDVAEGVYAVCGRARAPVDADVAALVGGDAGRRPVESIRVGATAGGDEQVRGTALHLLMGAVLAVRYVLLWSWGVGGPSWVGGALAVVGILMGHLVFGLVVAWTYGAHA